jgi:hypothetical protein
VLKRKTKINVFLYSDILKDALNKYANDHNTFITDLIENALLQMIDSNDFSISVDRVYDKAVQGKTALENQTSRRLSLVTDIELVDKADFIIDQQKPKTNRSLFIQESIRRYLEPILISEGYLPEPVFRNKQQAIENLKLLRSYMGFRNTKEFHTKFLKKENSDEYFISYRHYSLMERVGTGDIDRIINIISQKTNIEKSAFYLPSYDFQNYIDKSVRPTI